MTLEMSTLMGPGAESRRAPWRATRRCVPAWTPASSARSARHAVPVMRVTDLFGGQYSGPQAERFPSELGRWCKVHRLLFLVRHLLARVSPGREGREIDTTVLPR